MNLENFTLELLSKHCGYIWQSLVPILENFTLEILHDI